MSEPHEPRGRGALVWTVGLVAVSAIALFAPQSWFDGIQSLLGERPTATAFQDDVAALDTKLRTDGFDPETPTSERQQLEPLVLARRLTEAGPMTAEEMDEAAKIWREAMQNAANEPPEGSRDAHFGRAQRHLIERFPRLDPQRVKTQIERFREQTRPARPPGGTPASTDCASCHSETRALPGDVKMDASGIYPFMGDVPQFEDGRRFPVMVDSLELAAASARDESVPGTCLACHVPHGAQGFATTRDERTDNMGLWVNRIDTHPELEHVEVKVKNDASGHRAPGGRLGSAYIITVVATQNGAQLRQRAGQQLPKHLHTDTFTAGYAYARYAVDESGKVTSDPESVHRFERDTRLESGRFTQQQFAFDRRPGRPTEVEVTLWYLPDFTTWKGARAIRQTTE